MNQMSPSLFYLSTPNSYMPPISICHINNKPLLRELTPSKLHTHNAYVQSIGINKTPIGYGIL